MPRSTKWPNAQQTFEQKQASPTVQCLTLALSLKTQNLRSLPLSALCQLLPLLILTITPLVAIFTHSKDRLTILAWSMALRCRTIADRLWRYRRKIAAFQGTTVGMSATGRRKSRILFVVERTAKGGHFEAFVVLRKLEEVLVR